jgi:type I restriction enzyme S subunit
MGGERRADGPYISLRSALLRVETGWSPVCEPRLPAEDEWGVLKLSAVTSGSYVAAEAKALPSQVAPRTAYEVRPGDVLMSRANGVKALVGVACTVSETRSRLLLPDLVFRLVVNPDVLDQQFLGLVLKTAFVRGQIDDAMRGSSGQYKISKTDVQGLYVPHLGLDEQRRIVVAHAAFERRISGLERVRAKRVQLLQGVVNRLLSGLSETRTFLGEASRSIDAGITLGSHRVPRKHTAGYLRVANVRKGWVDSSDIARLEALERDRKRYGLQSGDVLVVEGHADPDQIARSAVVGPELAGLLYQNHLFRIRFDDVLPEFAMLWLNSETVRGYWRERCATSSGLYTINSRMLEQVPFPEAGPHEQQRIVSAWAAGNDSIRALERQIDKLRTVQQAVVEDLLGGQERRSAA